MSPYYLLGVHVVFLVCWSPSTSEHNSTACWVAGLLMFNLDCGGDGVISIMNSTSTNSTCDFVDGCCVYPGDCTSASPDIVMININRDCEGQQTCSVQMGQAVTGELTDCPGVPSNYQVVYYGCTLSTTIEILTTRVGKVTSVHPNFTATRTKSVVTSELTSPRTLGYSDTSPSGTSYLPPKEPDNGVGSLGIIIGAAAGVVVVIINLIIIVFIMKMRKTKGDSKKQTSQHEETSPVQTDADGYGVINPEQPDIVKSSSLQSTKPSAPPSNPTVPGKPSPPVSVAVTDDVLQEEAEYAVANKPLAQAKAAERKKGKDKDKKRPKPPKPAAEESEYGETWNMSTGQRPAANPSEDTEYYNTRPTTAAREPSGPRHSDPDYDQIGGQSINYASIDHGDAREDEEGEEQEDGYSTVDYNRPPAGQGGDDDDDDDVTLADNPVYN